MIRSGRRKVVILVIALWLCAIAAGFGVYGFIRWSRPKPPPPTDATVFAVLERTGGTMPIRTTISSGSPLFNELVAYVNSPGVTDGDLNFMTHAPGGIDIKTDVVQFSFRGNLVIFATRKGPNEPWHPAVRTMTEADAQIESMLSQFLKQSSVEEAGH